MRIDDFCRSSGMQQLTVLAANAEWLAEQDTGDVSSLYCILFVFYVELRFFTTKQPGIRIMCFTDGDPPFEQLVDALPVDPKALLRAAA